MSDVLRYKKRQAHTVDMAYINLCTVPSSNRHAITSGESRNPADKQVFPCTTHTLCIQQKYICTLFCCVQHMYSTKRYRATPERHQRDTQRHTAYRSVSRVWEETCLCLPLSTATQPTNGHKWRPPRRKPPDCSEATLCVEHTTCMINKQKGGCLACCLKCFFKLP